MGARRISLTTTLLSPFLAQTCAAATGISSDTNTTNFIITDEFSFSCLPLTTQLSDPIVSPGQQSSHTHVVTGGTAFQRRMGPETARSADETTCEVAIDRSNYWIPALYHANANASSISDASREGSFEMIEYEWSAIYYLNRACNHTLGATTCGEGSYPLAPPAGLRVIAGDPKLETYNDSDFSQRAISHMCLQQNGTSKETKHLPRTSCSKLRSQVFFPSCWDGKNLDSPDHKSHMAYPAIGDYNVGVCPKSHPIAIFSLFVEFLFNTAPFPDYENWVYATNDFVGYSLHGDFINGWTDQQALQRALETCTGEEWLRSPECSITKAQKRPLTPLPLEPEVPAPRDELGANKPIPILPGSPEQVH
ncbi:hypothetical protein ASPCAL14177 [Aspergillus calidoustus]|uniref:DUF1996 domain-containing protein n=1 Tax=Aspergillus calidoustus TaxID=454130 RepID=A0A0U5GJP4_ASPCI|nr:hypothetical protein ASPCAL14177 [Aspergillus calidoustus]